MMSVNKLLITYLPYYCRKFLQRYENFKNFDGKAKISKALFVKNVHIRYVKLILNIFFIFKYLTK